MLEAALLTVAAFFFALHFTHLTADFPNHSPWMDWSKYTDEGWYGDAAIRHFQRGHWYVPGDFNPGAALPLWPLVEAIVFRFSGVSLSAARALSVSVFGGILISAYLLVKRWQESMSSLPSAERLALSLDNAVRSSAGVNPSVYRISPDPTFKPNTHRTLAPAIGVLLLAVSPFFFSFTRVAILEPLLILLTLLALHAASGAFFLSVEQAGKIRRQIRVPAILSLGLLLPAMVLTKTTAIFLFPSIAFLLWASAGYSIRLFLRAALTASVMAATLWSAYFLLIVRPHFLIDYRYLFSANGYTGITAATALKVLRNTLVDGFWIGGWIYPLALLAVVWVLCRPRQMLRQPLFAALILWATGYAAFLAYHDNLQPRYYLVPGVPLVLLVALVFGTAFRHLDATWHPIFLRPVRPVVAVAVFLGLIAVVTRDALQTLRIVRHPEYTFIHAAEGIATIIKDNPDRNSLVLSISGSDLSLITGLPSICDDFGTLELVDRVRQYRPGWYAAWNLIEDDKMDALAPLYQPVRVATFPALDDPARNLLILYRLDPKRSVAELHRRQPVPRPLRTKVGQQPSETQLLH